MSDAVEALEAKRTERAAQPVDPDAQAVPIRADIFHLDAAMAIQRRASAARPEPGSPPAHPAWDEPRGAAGACSL
jgi:hypothetical protein